MHEPPATLRGRVIAAALTDRARILRSLVLVAGKVEGTSQASEPHGEWLPCRLIPEGSPELVGPEGATVRVVSRSQLLVGGEVELDGSERVEVDSRELGRATWEITSAAAPLRRRRRVAARLADLRRVTDHEP